MSDLVVMGIDSGLHSLAIAVLTNGRLTQVYQADTPRKDRAKTPDETGRWLKVVEGALSDSRPHVVGLEDFEPQPWKTKGRLPKGGVASQQLISQMRNICELHGIIVYTQSPSVTGVLPDGVYDRIIKQAMGKAYEPMPHLRDALAHAWEADSKYRKVRRLTGGD